MFFLFAVYKKTLTFGVEIVPPSGEAKESYVSLNGKELC